MVHTVSGQRGAGIQRQRSSGEAGCCISGRHVLARILNFFAAISHACGLATSAVRAPLVSRVQRRLTYRLTSYSMPKQSGKELVS